MEPFIGQIMAFGGNFAPRGWALCDGQLLSVASHTALFSILGTTYGGDGRTTFGLPDLRGRVPMHAGNGPGLSPVKLGQKSGKEQTQLTVQNLPSHNHGLNNIKAELNINEEDGVEADGVGRNIGVATQGELFNTNPVSTKTAEGTVSVVSKNGGALATDLNGGNIPFDNHQPYQAVYFIIALEGTYPSRS